MFNKVFVKKLKSQESGYSGDKPNQRGKYILIGQNFLEVFPHLTTQSLNDQAIMRCKMLDGSEIAVNIIYHNARFFPETHARAHNEVRLYRNKLLDDSLKLDRNVVVVIAKMDDGTFGIVSIQPSDDDYSAWSEIAESIQNIGPIDYSKIKNKSKAKDLAYLDKLELSPVVNTKEIIDKYTKVYQKSREQQPGHENDPANPLSSLIKGQKDFSDYVREMYGGKCALRGEPLIKDQFIGMDAAHIQPHTHQGPLLPTNGFLLSKDLHDAFERGFFTLDASNKVIVSNQVNESSSLWKYHNNIVSPIGDYEIFKPYESYTSYHRGNIYKDC